MNGKSFIFEATLTSLDLSLKPQVKDNVAEEQIGDELFLHDGDNPRTVHVLNGGAAIVWYLCDGTRDLNAIVDEISSSFSVPRSQALVDVQEAVAQFETLGLLAER